MKRKIATVQEFGLMMIKAFIGSALLQILLGTQSSFAE
jgi:hypothetical protein